ncbi:phosphonate C-P lyase system protein PhnG [Leptothrix discophora]|uniref:Phosphonate C-P lyase system protein PhnG n=1 Tax=Leptothrix discophora TaxID=89 RepID=A0ABT9G753_LEPDI|nr:phosphonate C-P lyase system protein PhnG [Leptothrix discophora]MDP4302087.1 phosphonate C-P lyase system protein PhnG [Leptothrix discophora]
MTAPDDLDAESVADRQDWLALLAASPRALLAEKAAPWLATQTFEDLRPAEMGLVMLRARISRDGDRFHVGEAPVTRCALRLCTPEDDGLVGIGYVIGRDPERARWTAALDALLQHPGHAADVRTSVLEPLARAVAAARAAEAAQVATTRVHFHTVQGEAA